MAIFKFGKNYTSLIENHSYFTVGIHAPYGGQHCFFSVTKDGKKRPFLVQKMLKRLQSQTPKKNVTKIEDC
jgi:hypothetical protein